jgi:type IV pilus assembly PilO-like protein
MKVRRQLIAVGGLIAAAVVIAVVGVFTVVLPQRAKVATLHDDFAQTQTQILTIQATRGGAHTSGSDQIFQLSRAMPDSVDMPGILLALSRVAAASSTSLASVRPAAAVTLADGSSAVPLQVVVTGSFSGISRFLHIVRSEVRIKGQTVRSTGRLFLADSIDLSANSSAPTPGSPPAGEVTASLALVAFDFGTTLSATPVIEPPTAETATPPASSASASGSPTSSTSGSE